MKLLRIYPETLDVQDDYILTVSTAAKSLKDAVGQTLPVKALAIMEQEAVDTDEVMKFARVLTDVGECYGTSSQSFIRALETAWDFADRREVEISALDIVQQRSKKNHDFLLCVAKYK